MMTFPIFQATVKRFTSNIAFCYGSISLFSTVLHNIFILYHIDMFVSVFKIDKTSFWIGETIFLIWNCVNDPLFGWLGAKNHVSKTEDSANNQLHTFPTRSSHTHKRKFEASNDILSESGISKNIFTTATPSSLIVARTRTISICGPLLALSFVILWFDWKLPAVQFSVCLCLYDTFLTMVDLHQSALLADLSITATDRNTMNSYESIFSAIGSLSVFVSYQCWDKNDLTDFRNFCVCLAIFSAVGFYVMSSVLQSSYIRKQDLANFNDQHLHKADIREDIVTLSLSQRKSLKIFISQLLKHKNFLMFTIINIIQVFHCHFNSNFFPVFMVALVEDHKHFGSFLIGVSFVLPHLNNLLFLRLCRHYGLYSVIKVLFSVKLILALIMWRAGLSYGWLMCFFIASNRVFTEGTCKLLVLVITDLIDEDYVRNGRKQPISTLIFGMANFLAKPGQTLAPILGTSLLSYLTGQDVFINRDGEHPGIPEGPDRLVHKDACFKLLVFVPLVCGALQIFVWSFFKLHGTQLQRIKSARSNLQQILLTV